jgi:A/G-specific adenine glycosylase
MANTYDDFQQVVWNYYRRHGRHDLPWRTPETDGSFDPYKILVSEIMLQQTQVARVMPKFKTFINEFPTVQSLASVPLGVVLVLWQGLGYNRRARFLWLAAQKIVNEHSGIFPRSQRELVTLPGVGSNTAGAVLAYAYGEPAAFVETNIRTVFIHHFFKDEQGVHDKDILALVRETMPDQGGHYGVRHWYWALMDYGTHLKQTVGNTSRASKSYVRQSKFVGSTRQLRGKVLRVLADGPMPELALVEMLCDERSQDILSSLLREGLIGYRDGMYELP